MITTINEFKEFSDKDVNDTFENDKSNMIMMEIPPEEEWFTFKNSIIPKGIEYMDNTYFIKTKDVPFFRDNIGKLVKFNYMNGKHRIIYFPQISKNY